jgi:cholesterol transport system auxiliary component
VDLYNLTPERNYSTGLPTVDWQLVVEEPLATGGFDNNRIAVRPSPTELKYFAGARWSERAPRMVQNLIVQSFEDSGKIIAVGRQIIGLRSDYNLKLELREFQAEVYREGEPPQVRVRINAKMVRQPRQEIIASKNFEQLVTCQGRGMKEVVGSFDLALGRVIREMVEWSLKTPGAKPEEVEAADLASGQGQK